MHREYVACPDCVAGVDLETGGACVTCEGAGGWWVTIEWEGGFRISFEPHERQADPEPP